jgi:hypothetical protein
MILYNLYILILTRIEDKLMVFLPRLVIKLQPNPGELVELLPVFLELLVAVPTEPDKELSVTCVEVVVCLHQPKFSEDGTDE